MRRLLLLRHAKSSWDLGDIDDRSRPLAPRGRRAAPVMGRFISGQGLVPDLVICSTAERARQTLELVTAEWERSPGKSVRVDMRASVYMASISELLSIVRRLDGDLESVMIIGHNPGMSSFAGRLALRGNPRDIKTMASKFPTAALAVLDFEIETWKAVAPGAGFLHSFVRPKDLA